jgi:hypothetical protein
MTRRKTRGIWGKSAIASPIVHFTRERLKLTHKIWTKPFLGSSSYPSEISTGPLKRNYSFNSVSFFKDTHLTDQALVHIFFTDLIATHYRKDMYQNWLGILAAFGGLLGLFLGFSLVTGFELVYFFTIRTFFDKLAEKTVKTKK